MSETTATPTRRNSLVVGLFLGAYGAYNLLSGYGGDNLTGFGSLLLGLGLLLGVVAEQKVGEPLGQGLKVASWATIAVGVGIAVIDVFGLAS